MSKTWYPMINYSKCKGCLVCYEMCMMNVYILNNDKFPVVVYGEGCLHGCKGCGDECPEKAIVYFGDK